MKDSTGVVIAGRDNWPAWALLARRSGYLLATSQRVYRIAASLRDKRESEIVATAAGFMFAESHQCRLDARSCWLRGQQ